MVRIMDEGDYSPKTWLRPDLRGQHLKVPMEPDLHWTWLACRQGDRSFGHCERSFIFLVKFAKNQEAASMDLKRSKNLERVQFWVFRSV